VWDDQRQARLDSLRAAEAEYRLTGIERAELDRLVELRCRHDQEALLQATDAIERENASLEERIREAGAQNRALAERVHAKGRGFNTTRRSCAGRS
jgi:hypothetical protein